MRPSTDDGERFVHLHILGIAGTFMGGVARIAREAGHEVTGSDRRVYPPMSTQLEQAGIPLIEGFDPGQLSPPPDQVVVGNIMTRGMPIIEAMLNERLPYASAPEWLYEQVLSSRRVLAVSGTHGKTTTASMLAWILEKAGLAPGFLIGGVPLNFGESARLGVSPWFVIEADEYDTAFFDKRSKFVHYHPEILVINNLEFDHADIFADLAAIQTQFHHLMRMVPGNGVVIYPRDDEAVREVLERGCWSRRVEVAVDSGAPGWGFRLLAGDGSRFEVSRDGEAVGVVEWTLLGQHNVRNALAAIAAAETAGVPVAQSIAALAEFRGVARRMQLRGEKNGVRVYDDFAHHPTAIDATLRGLRAKVGNARILVAFEPRSNTMKMGVHQQRLGAAFQEADAVFFYMPPDLAWRMEDLETSVPARRFDSVNDLLDALIARSRPGDHILIMSNGGFDNLPARLTEAL